MHRDGAALVRRFVEEVTNRGRLEMLDELVAEHHVGHDPFGDHYGPVGLGIGIMELRSAFPDLQVTIDDLVLAGDLVVHRFTLVGTHRGPFIGLPATDRAVKVSGLTIDRVVDGQLVERWNALDALGLMRQLGAVPILRRQVT